MKSMLQAPSKHPSARPVVHYESTCQNQLKVPKIQQKMIMSKPIFYRVAILRIHIRGFLGGCLLVLVSATPEDVFLSFRGIETRKGFARHLHNALEEAGIPTFFDEFGIQTGESIDSEIERAINESKISIILFSKLYATSTYCLDEVVMIMERRRTAKNHVVPIFYKVSPSEVQLQTGNYGLAFDEHEKQFKNEIHKVEKWRAALRKITDLRGVVLKDGQCEVEFIEKIVEDTRNELSYTVRVVENDLNDTVRNAATYFIWDRFFVIKLKVFLLFIVLLLVFISIVPLFGTKNYAFVSIGGTDTEEFTSDLLEALSQSGIYTYGDHTRIKRSVNSWLKIRISIYISKISIVVFSKDYPSSKWSLDELVLIMERRRADDGYVVVPFFYDVDPSEVQKQIGAYGDVFTRYENNFKAGIVKEWRAALKEAADQVGGQTLQNRDDQQFAQDIALMIGNILNRLLSFFK
ncbi:unnamed protein product [Dovyalis caffra]|uniref:TIR domain-containing protein n=1 Tax=Dovyalis caffra TaxID=77055 RepID=A0AAV1SVW9_9ROSI|nr:unnamed protein product [Dovyalis caffra]